MDEILLEIFTIVSVLDESDVEATCSQNESVASAYPRLCSARWEFVPCNGKLIHLKISELLSDAEVIKICESLSVQTLYSLIKQKLNY